MGYNTAATEERRKAALRKELEAVRKQEERLERAALRVKPAAWRMELEEKIPEKVYHGLEAAFCKGFDLVFSKGRRLIEKSYKKDSLLADYHVRDCAVQAKGGRRELRQMRRSAGRLDLLNTALTTAEGIGLGAVGIGMPDIVLFISTLLKGIYETALHYGFQYESGQEQLLILKMMQTGMSDGAQWLSLNREVDRLLLGGNGEVAKQELQVQSRATASTFAMDMLILKFIQGIPVIGVVGGCRKPGLLPEGHAVCAAEIQEAVSAATGGPAALTALPGAWHGFPPVSKRKTVFAEFGVKR